MGQYHIPVNFDRREFIHPHKFGDGLKMLEFGCSGIGTLTGLTLLLANSHSRGGGDLHADRDGIMGRWAGDRIAILGDYSEYKDFEVHEGLPTHVGEDEFKDAMEGGVWGDEEASNAWTDISERVLTTMAKDEYIRESMLEQAKRSYSGSPFRKALMAAGIDIPPFAPAFGQTEVDELKKALRPDLIITA